VFLTVGPMAEGTGDGLAEGPPGASDRGVVGTVSGLMLLVGQQRVELPALLGGGTSWAPYAVLLPVPVTIASAYGLTSRSRAREHVAHRRAWAAPRGDTAARPRRRIGAPRAYPGP